MDIQGPPFVQVLQDTESRASGLWESVGGNKNRTDSPVVYEGLNAGKAEGKYSR